MKPVFFKKEGGKLIGLKMPEKITKEHLEPVPVEDEKPLFVMRKSGMLFAFKKARDMIR